ncbi:MAG: NAD(P)/FAD-dependent oxidoreductase [Myxococcales bacterium]|nr:NAD(P)/FAD-dependent oxidoreductase [Myxococcales bacterium]
MATTVEPTMERWDAMIVGSGPAGCAAALYLHQRDRRAAERVLLLERDVHPRDKTCAGGLIAQVDDLLAPLGMDLDPLPQHRINRIRIRTEGRVATLEDAGVSRIIRRRDFDAFLAAEVRSRGFDLREGEAVREIVRDGGGFRLETDRGAYWTRAVVAADGMGGVVRRKLLPDAPQAVSRLCMVDVPVDPDKTVEFREHAFSWDFACVDDGILGYVWDFPNWIAGRPYLNVGVFDWEQRAERRRNLRERVVRELERRGYDPAGLPCRSWSARQYRRGQPLSAPGVLLVGDAAGIDPAMGEGISNAIEYGRHAADALHAAFGSGDYAFSGYDRAVHRSSLGRRLRSLGLSARIVYGGLARPAVDLWARDPQVARGTAEYFCRPDAPRAIDRGTLLARGIAHLARYGVETLRGKHPRVFEFAR